MAAELAAAGTFRRCRGALGGAVRSRAAWQPSEVHLAPAYLLAAGWACKNRRNVLTAHAFDNDDYVDVVIHSYRHRLGLAPGHAPYDDIERRLADQPSIPVPTITLDGQADGNFPATDGAASTVHFTGPRTHRQAPNAGHNLPQESPDAFAKAVLDLSHPGRAN